MLDPDRQQQERRDPAETLKTLRKAAGLSGERLAARCSMSQSKISRIEQGKILSTVAEVQRLLTALKVPGEIASDLIDMARIANVHYKSFRAYAQVGLWRAQAEVQAMAESSAVVRQFMPAIPSGLLQTEPYARHVFSPSVPGEVARNVDRAVQARLDSQQVLRDDSRTFLFLMPEHAVRWRQGDSRVMADQCSHMADVSSQFPNIEIAVVAQSVHVADVPLHPFVIYDERLVEIELFAGEVVFCDPKDVGYHLNIFEFFWEHALTGDDATSLLRSIADEFMRELD